MVLYNRGKYSLICFVCSLFFMGNFPISVMGTEIFLKNTVYMGVKGYGSMGSSLKNTFTHLFYVEGEVREFTLAYTDGYLLQNQLATGYVFDVMVSGNVVTSVSEPTPLAEGWIGFVSKDEIEINGVYYLQKNATGCSIENSAGIVNVRNYEPAVGDSVKIYGEPVSAIFETVIAPNYSPVVSGNAGDRTIKNFLATAMEPMGIALYVYGGGWDWQDMGASNASRTIGISQKWIEFFQNTDMNYSYTNKNSYAMSYFPHYGWNQYHYAGLDCTGYVGWVLYNTLNSESGSEGYVVSSNVMAKTLAETYGFGTITKNFSNNFKPGDIFSMENHVYICVGVCSDGSMVIAHSSPTSSYTGFEGGGVQLTGMGNSSNCEAVELAQYYMSTYYPQWSERYQAVYKPYSSYTYMPRSSHGKFSWHISSEGLLDPDGYLNLSAGEILELLFTEEEEISKEQELEVEKIPESTTRGEAIVYMWQALGEPTGSGEIKFQDIGVEGEMLWNAVDWATTNKITVGTSEYQFSPNDLVTRGQFMMFLWILAGKPMIELEIPFQDVYPQDYYMWAVSWAVSEKLTGGTAPTTFSPVMPVNYVQMSLFMSQFLKQYQ